MAMAVQQRPFGDGPQRQGARPKLANDEFLESERSRGEPARPFAPNQRRNFVAEAEETTRLEPNDRDTARNKRREGIHAALGLAVCFIHATHGQECAPAAQRPSALFRHVYPAPGGNEHLDRGVDGLRLEVPVEGIDE